MIKVPEFLKKGDKVGIVAPASRIPHSLNEVVDLLSSWGLEVHLGEHLYSSFHQFSGKDEVRASDLQEMLDDVSIKAVFAARGGYGTVRIIDDLDFTSFIEQPKWVVGFSDITVLHSHIQSLYAIPTIHGQMPLTIPDATKESLISLKNALFGEELHYSYATNRPSLSGEADGVLVGGNLAILASLAGSISEVDYRDKILFIEDIGEHHYAVDRMLRMLKRAGKLQALRGMIIGGFTEMKDKAVNFGYGIEEIVLNVVHEYAYPVASDFPAGHIDNNNTLIFGRKVSLEVRERQVMLKYL